MQVCEGTYWGVEVADHLHHKGSPPSPSAAVMGAGVQKVAREAGVVARTVGAGPLAIQQLQRSTQGELWQHK